MELGYFSISGNLDGESISLADYIGVKLEQKPDIIISTVSAGNMGNSYETENPNRLHFYRKLGINSEKTVSVKQEHTRTVYFAGDCVNNRRVNIPPVGDGVVTDNPDDVLAVTVADCLPIFLFTDNGSCFGAFHSGWKGTGIVNNGIEKMESEFGVNPGKIHGLIGPGIGPCCYTVEKERAELFISRYGPGSVKQQTVLEERQYQLDIREANVSLLRDQGIASLSVCTVCTACSDFFGSYRREGAEEYTRMIALIGYL